MAIRQKESADLEIEILILLHRQLLQSVIIIYNKVPFTRLGHTADMPKSSETMSMIPVQINIKKINKHGLRPV